MISNVIKESRYNNVSGLPKLFVTTNSLGLAAGNDSDDVDARWRVPYICFPVKITSFFLAGYIEYGQVVIFTGDCYCLFCRIGVNRSAV